MDFNPHRIDPVRTNADCATSSGQDLQKPLKKCAPFWGALFLYAGIRVYLSASAYIWYRDEFAQLEVSLPMGGMEIVSEGEPIRLTPSKAAVLYASANVG